VQNGAFYQKSTLKSNTIHFTSKDFIELEILAFEVAGTFFGSIFVIFLSIFNIISYIAANFHSFIPFFVTGNANSLLNAYKV